MRIPEPNPASTWLRRCGLRSSPPIVVGSAQRRQVLSLALLPLLAPASEVLALPGFGIAPGKPQVSILGSPDVCQARIRDQDFAVVRYVCRFADGTPFDVRYAERPLIYEVGNFYLPGVDEAIAGACVGTKLLLTWKSSPSLGPEFEQALPKGSAIEMRLSIDSIRYNLFGEKMRNAQNNYWFAEQPLTLTSPYDTRGHLSARDVVVGKDNPFSIAPGEKSIISNPSSLIVPLFDYSGKGEGGT